MNFPAKLELPTTLTAALFLLASSQIALSYDPPPPPPECAINWCEVVQGPTGSITYTNVVLWPESNVCLGTWVCAWPEATYTCNDTIGRIVWSPQTTNCLPYYWTNHCQSPFFITNWWVLSFPNHSRSEAGESMCFFPTNCGEGTITFYGTWRNWDVCTGLPIGGDTTSKSISFKVANVQIAEPWKATCVNGTTGFTLTNTCGSVTWEIVTNGTGGEPTISGGTVTAGTNCGSWTVTARSTWNTNCTASSTVYVVNINSECVATTPTNRDRTTIGVGEEVSLMACGVPPGDVTWTTSAGTLSLTNGTSTSLTAPGHTDTATVTLHYTNGFCTKDFSVIEPASVNMVTNGLRHSINRPDIGIRTAVYIAPDTVNFYAVYCREETNNFVANGVYTFMNGLPHDAHPGEFPCTDTVVPDRGTLWSAQDNIYSGDPNTSPPFIPGTETCTIPWDFRVGTNAWAMFDTLTHNCSLGGGGVLSASKDGASWSCNVTNASSSY